MIYFNKILISYVNGQTSFNEDKCKTMVIKTASFNRILDNDFSYTMLRQDGSRFELNETTQERDLDIN